MQQHMLRCQASQLLGRLRFQSQPFTKFLTLSINAGAQRLAFRIYGADRRHGKLNVVIIERCAVVFIL